MSTLMESFLFEEKRLQQALDKSLDAVRELKWWHSSGERIRRVEMCRAVRDQLVLVRDRILQLQREQVKQKQDIDWYQVLQVTDVILQTPQLRQAIDRCSFCAEDEELLKQKLRERGIG